MPSELERIATMERDAWRNEAARLQSEVAKLRDEKKREISDFADAKVGSVYTDGLDRIWKCIQIPQTCEHNMMNPANTMLIESNWGAGVRVRCTVCGGRAWM